MERAVDAEPRVPADVRRHAVGREGQDR
jgi:hypothetical protein